MASTAMEKLLQHKKAFEEQLNGVEGVVKFMLVNKGKTVSTDDGMRLASLELEVVRLRRLIPSTTRTIGFLGPLQSGKSTLINHLLSMGLSPADSKLVSGVVMLNETGSAAVSVPGLLPTGRGLESCTQIATRIQWAHSSSLSVIYMSRTEFDDSLQCAARACIQQFEEWKTMSLASPIDMRLQKFWLEMFVPDFSKVFDQDLEATRSLLSKYVVGESTSCFDDLAAPFKDRFGKKITYPAENLRELQVYLRTCLVGPSTPQHLITKSVLVDADFPILKNGLCLLDLPGYGDPNPAITAITDRFRQSVDDLILIHPLSMALGDETIVECRKVCEMGLGLSVRVPLQMVLTKCDSKLSLTALEKFQMETETQLKSKLKVDDFHVNVFPISTVSTHLHGLEEVVHAFSKLLDVSDFEAQLNFLEQQLSSCCQSYRNFSKYQPPIPNRSLGAFLKSCLDTQRAEFSISQDDCTDMSIIIGLAAASFGLPSLGLGASTRGAKIYAGSRNISSRITYFLLTCSTSAVYELVVLHRKLYRQVFAKIPSQSIAVLSFQKRIQSVKGFWSTQFQEILRIAAVPEENKASLRSRLEEVHRSKLQELARSFVSTLHSYLNDNGVHKQAVEIAARGGVDVTLRIAAVYAAASTIELCEALRDTVLAWLQRTASELFILVSDVTAMQVGNLEEESVSSFIHSFTNQANTPEETECKVCYDQTENVYCCSRHNCCLSCWFEILTSSEPRCPFCRGDLECTLRLMSDSAFEQACAQLHLLWLQGDFVKLSDLVATQLSTLNLPPLENFSTVVVMLLNLANIKARYCDENFDIIAVFAPSQSASGATLLSIVSSPASCDGALIALQDFVKFQPFASIVSVSSLNVWCFAGALVDKVAVPLFPDLTVPKRSRSVMPQESFKSDLSTSLQPVPVQSESASRLVSDVVHVQPLSRVSKIVEFVKAWNATVPEQAWPGYTSGNSLLMAVIPYEITYYRTPATLMEKAAEFLPNFQLTESDLVFAPASIGPYPGMIPISPVMDILPSHIPALRKADAVIRKYRDLWIGLDVVNAVHPEVQRESGSVIINVCVQFLFVSPQCIVWPRELDGVQIQYSTARSISASHFVKDQTSDAATDLVVGHRIAPDFSSNKVRRNGTLGFYIQNFAITAGHVLLPLLVPISRSVAVEIAGKPFHRSNYFNRFAAKQIRKGGWYADTPPRMIAKPDTIEVAVSWNADCGIDAAKFELVDSERPTWRILGRDDKEPWNFFEKALQRDGIIVPETLQEIFYDFPNDLFTRLSSLYEKRVFAIGGTTGLTTAHLVGMNGLVKFDRLAKATELRCEAGFVEAGGAECLFHNQWIAAEFESDQVLNDHKDNGLRPFGETGDSGKLVWFWAPDIEKAIPVGLFHYYIDVYDPDLRDYRRYYFMTPIDEVMKSLDLWA